MEKPEKILQITLVNETKNINNNPFKFITCQKTHGASHNTKHPLQGHLYILLNLIVGRCAKVDVEYLEIAVIPGRT